MSIRITTLLLRTSFQTKPRIAQFNSYFQRYTMASIPTTMKAAQYSKNGGVEILQYTDVSVPKPKDNEVLVKNEYVGLNYIDIYYRTGLYSAPLPQITGREAEGTVVALGASTPGIKIGDRVAYLHESTGAEYTAVPAAKVYTIPATIAPGVAAASLLQGLTALTLIREAHYVKKGDWVLVHAAAGGVGLLLVQLLKAVGARVIGTSSSKEKLELARENGVEFPVNYKDDDVVARVKEITGGEGVRVVFDSTGKDQFDNDLQVVTRKGSIVSFGNSSGKVPPISLDVLAAKNLKLLRPRLFNYITTREEFERYTGELFEFITKGQLNVKIHETYPLADVARAHTDIESRKTSGKLLFKV
ncbi:hypothetical protein BJ878DRAFT_498688 [Calycina marina]|uniref:Probable quinone oxidoreductase n=1 Tax=Calycina marina TaxID=1763456 RepID=A0A9P7Z6M2_9HELO|nr:hypothetical protein BJ878DRAFT_498688 [Calycina marina]